MSAKILICDDEVLLRKLLVDHVSTLGYKVFEASNGQECINIVKQHVPDAILLDLAMPEMNGIEVIRELKKMNIDVPVFVLSGYGQSGANGEATELGVAGFIPKPYRLNEIDLILENSLR